MNIFTAVKYCCILHGRVFVMVRGYKLHWCDSMMIINKITYYAVPLVLDNDERSITSPLGYEHLHELTFVQFPRGPVVVKTVDE